MQKLRKAPRLNNIFTDDISPVKNGLRRDIRSRLSRKPRLHLSCNAGVKGKRLQPWQYLPRDTAMILSPACGNRDKPGTVVPTCPEKNKSLVRYIPAVLFTTACHGVDYRQPGAARNRNAPIALTSFPATGPRRVSGIVIPRRSETTPAENHKSVKKSFIFIKTGRARAWKI